MLKRVERLLLAVAVGSAVWLGTAWTQSTAFERSARAAVAVPAPVAPPADTAAADTERLPSGAPIGMLEIPRLRFSEAVAEGDSDAILQRSIGHLPDTPLPWEKGNSVLAGHRDTHFRALQTVKIGDRLVLRTSRGTTEYEVADKLIVKPTDLSVLAPTATRTLTLVTCYPFSYIGRAPQRFIVIAHEKR